ncbi:MAG: serine/threonine protein kinase [Synechococcales cyanobacterium M58_A2018_015]|nr:serine/threonine protein kinase [Synechococcales cyanobacterium M58_A2018_015]
MVTAGSELTPGTSVDRRYRIQCVLGRGGFGRTYLAADERRFGELCVLKEFVPNPQADPVVAQKLRELFQREAAILHKLDHPQIPRFFAGFEEDGRLFIAQEYIDGKTYWRILQERQRNGQTFSQAEIIEWLRDLLLVLDYLHGQNIVHRDISPDNIMLPRRQTSPVLIDFGVVKQVLPELQVADPNHPDDLIQASVSVGKFGYAPHEQIRMGQCSPRSDLYALAVTAIVLLTGKSPNQLIDAKSLEWKWKRQVRLDSRLVAILEQMTAEKPQDRYPSAKRVLKELQPLWEPVHTLKAKIRVAQPNSPVRMAATAATQNRATWMSAALPFKAINRSAIPPEPTTLLPTQASLTQPCLPTNLRLLPTEPDGIESIDAYLDPIARTETHRTEAGPISTTASYAETAGALALIAPAFKTSALALRSQAKVLVATASAESHFSVKRALVMSCLALLPIAGALVGVRSPYIAPLCSMLENCAQDQVSEQRYRQAVEQAEAAKTRLQNARSLTDLQQARDQLADAVAQLSAFSSGSRLLLLAQADMHGYQTILQALDGQLETETRAVQLLNRAEAEAQKAAEQTKVAKTLPQQQAAVLQWRRALETLRAIPSRSFVANSATARSREYTARLEAVDLQMAAASPASPPTEPPPPQEVQVTPVSTQPVNRTPPPAQPAPQARPTTAARPAPQPVPKPRVASPTRAAARPAAAPSQSNRAQPVRATSPQTPQTYPLEVNSEWVAGNVITSATQTLNDVSIWIDGSRTQADGTFVANLTIQNRSNRGFGFVPLYAESRNSAGQVTRSRVLFTSSAGDTTLEPGEYLTGQIYLLERAALQNGSQQIRLIIQESTSGDRIFRIPF